MGEEVWTEEVIRQRSARIAEPILEIWPVPPQHRSGFRHEKKALIRPKISLADLIVAGELQPGIRLFPRQKPHRHAVVTLLADGRLDVEGKIYSGPREAASAITDHPTNGWWFFMIDLASRRTLRMVRSEYVNAKADEVEGDEEGDDEDDEG